MKSITFAAAILLGGAVFAPACSANPLLVGREIEGGGPSACARVGGTCVLAGVVACASEAPNSAQDCDTSGNLTGTGGDLCCLTFPDLGAGREAGPGDTDSGNGDSTTADSGLASACASTGGTCIGSNVPCAKEAPTGAQDCNHAPNPSGAFCCLALPDAGEARDAGPVDGGHRSSDGGNSDGGGSACASAGGTCINDSMACAKDAPPNVQDCTPNARGAFCCLSPL
jgi:hypothetical protein